MLKRKSHSKSRKGCQNCKRRHVKCDEQGPPCANCVVRETTSTCIYTQSSQNALAALRSRGQDVAAPARRSQGDQAAPAAAESFSGSRSPASESSAAPVAEQQQQHHHHHHHPEPPVRPAPAEGEVDRLLDLELMHRWTTVTYKTLVSVPNDESYLQVGVPIEALKCDYLLNALLAVTALEKVMTESESSSSEEERGGSGSMAATGSSRSIRDSNRRYIRAAIEYYDRGINGFRAALPTVGPENHHVLYFASLLARHRAHADAAVPARPLGR
ncbi:hypothetical protein MAPG_04305 [Magnaporthiopsis poae ATCC 64411]|uniref:Zn(2)-C6 fungal-type domain-containing protein n=1 Tax=Magnaporthiopsis poae (strain ATCC 64411 / 73-15) TaxID=644358 RepID=A0A0C4DWC9_MAGP6|nr:hypothetical protein MAPG_04305 [Magnaporthiopsis poae ATCC 64411]